MKLPSKRLITRLAVLTVVVTVGGFAIAQAHLALKKGDVGQTDPAQEGAANPLIQDVQAIPDTQDVAQAPSRSNPFTSSRLLPVSHVEEGDSPAPSRVSDAAYRNMDSPAGGSTVAAAGLSTAVAAAAIGDSPAPPPPSALPADGYRSGYGTYGDSPARTAADVAETNAAEGRNVLRTRVAPAPTPAPADPRGGPDMVIDPNSRYALPAAPPAPAALAPAAVGTAAIGAAAIGAAAESARGPNVGDSQAEPPVPMERPLPIDSGYRGSADMASPGTSGLSEPYVATLPATSDRRRDNAAQGGASPDAEGTGTPGEPELEGPQAPSLVMAKSAPSEVQVGKPALFTTQIRNVGQSTATNVVVRDEVPKGTRLVETSPVASRVEGSSVYWELGDVKPNEDKTVSMQVTPLNEGEIGSVATVTFAAQASVRTQCTRPELVIEHTAPHKVLIGTPVAFSIRISNPGTGSATGVILEENVPEGLSHPAGTELEFEVGTLKPGETRELELTLVADKPGIVKNLLLCRSDANLVAEDTLDIEVVAPGLKLAVGGPRKCYLERPVTYEINVANPGTAPAKEVELVAYLPQGVRFVETNNAGAYDAERHAVFWSVAELPAEGGGSVKLKVMPVEDGEQKIRVEGRAETGLVDLAERVTMVEGVASLFFELADSEDPIAVGGDTLYEIRVLNEGSKASENIQVVATLPPELKPLNGEGATKGVIQGQSVMFQPLARLAPKADATFKIRVQGVGAGHHRIRVAIHSDEMQSPVIREEITLVYSNE